MNPIKKLIQVYKEFFSIVKSYIKVKLLPKLAKAIPAIKVHKTVVKITEVPPGTKEEILSAEIVRLKAELERLKQENERLKEQLDEKRKEALAKFIKEVALQELKREGPVDLARLLTRLRLSKLPFVKKITVLTFDHEFLGYWDGLELVEGGFRLRIYDPYEKKMIYTPTYNSFYEAFVDVYNIHKQLKANVIIINAIRDPETGELYKLDIQTLNEYYAGVPAKKIVAKLLEEVRRFRNELAREKVLRELTSIKLADASAKMEYVTEINKAILNLMESKERNISNVIPYVIAGLLYSDLNKIETARAELKVQETAEKARELESKLRSILEKGDIEKLLTLLYSIIEKQQQILSDITEIKKKLESPETTKK